VEPGAPACGFALGLLFCFFLFYVPRGTVPARTSVPVAVMAVLPTTVAARRRKYLAFWNGKETFLDQERNIL